MAERIQEYTGGGITVRFDPGRCIHVGQCSAGLVRVFKPRERPWVDVSAASADEIANVVERCPSGALTYERVGGGASETPQVPTTIEPRRDGPLWVRGDLAIRDATGEVALRTTRMAVCRCGGSSNKPFCDNTHRSNGWRTEDPSPAG